MRRLTALFLLLLLVPPSPAFGEVWDWEVFMSVYTVRTLIRVDDDLWGATNGGLFRFHLPTETFETFTNADGLSYNDIRCMTLDGRGNLILGMGNAYVDVFNLVTHQVTSISDFKLNSKIFQIYALYNDQGTIYVGTDIGVSRLIYYENWQRYLIQGNFSNLGSFEPEIPAKAIQVFDSGLWIGTDDGLARGDLSLPYLESPEGWANFTTADGLSSNEINALTVFRDTLYVAANSGLNRLADSSFQALQVSNSSGIAFLKVHQDTLYYGRSGGIYRLEGNQGIKYGSTQAKGLTLEFAADGAMWAGMQVESNRLGGLRKLAGDDWLYYAPEGPRFDVIADLVVLDDGSLWVTGAQATGSGGGGLAHFDGQHWINLTRQNDAYALGDSVSPDSFFWNDIRALALDHSGNLWVGNNGRGVAWFHFEGDTVLANGYYPASSGRLFGIASASGANFCVVRDLLTDDWGNVWICNSEADPIDGPPIAIVPTDFIQDTAAFPNWVYLTVISNGAPLVNAEFQVDRIAQDSFGRKWFGGNNNKGKDMWVLDDQGTLSADDDVWTELSGLPSDSITAIVCDHDGIVWVGTPSGVQYFYPVENAEDLEGIDLYYLPVGQSVRAIGVDPQNNKWFGTTSGVSVLSSDNFTWLSTFTTLAGDYPSPLPGDLVQAIAFNPQAGYVYLGTDKGLARLQTPYKSMGGTVSLVSVWPNPFVISPSSTARLYFDPSGLDLNAELKIFTASGLLVKHLTLAEINSGWDGRNMNNELVATGVYLLLAYSSDGSAAVSKVAVIHQ